MRVRITTKWNANPNTLTCLQVRVVCAYIPFILQNHNGLFIRWPFMVNLHTTKATTQYTCHNSNLEIRLKGYSRSALLLYEHIKCALRALTLSPFFLLIVLNCWRQQLCCFNYFRWFHSSQPFYWTPRELLHLSIYLLTYMGVLKDAAEPRWLHRPLQWWFLQIVWLN